jgi:hypothetical protein
MWTRFLLAFTIATNMLAQQDPTDLLLRVETRIAESLDRLPRYMCTETIDRSRFESGVHSRSTACEEDPTRANNNLTTSDRLRLDITKATAVEMHSWVGESRFDGRDLLDMVHEGALSTGSFGIYLGAIFRFDDASFTYNGQETLEGRTLSEFGFRIPQEKSHYFFYGEGQHGVITVMTARSW